ncbi:MAG: GNAT family N-acetyltransferase [Litorilinea sp.]
MIRKFAESDRSALQALLLVAPELNIYMLGNLAALGTDHEISEFWGDFGPDHKLRGAVNRYMRGWSIFGNPDADWAGLAAILDAHSLPAERLQDNPGGIPSILPYLRAYTAARIDIDELMTLAAPNFRPSAPPPAITVRAAHAGDLDALADFYANADTMQRSRTGVERPLQDGYLWIAESDGEICSTALTNAVGAGYAMIGGVYTPPAWRGHGLSQAVCSALCAALLANDLIPALYWVAPDAGHIYHKLGFKPVGSWRSVRLMPHPK